MRSRLALSYSLDEIGGVSGRKARHLPPRHAEPFEAAEPCGAAGPFTELFHARSLSATGASRSCGHRTRL